MSTKATSVEETLLHTPGPWMPGDETDGPSMRLMVYCNDALGSRIADCSNSGHGITDVQDRANVRLISAAPELLVALKGLLERFWVAAETHNDRSCDYDVCPEVRAAVAALKKVGVRP